jgi:methylitaconate Delta-isomerase
VTPAIPKLYLISPPADYVDLVGRPVRAEQINVVGRGLIMRQPHQAYAATILVCTAAAALIPGTVVHQAARQDPENPGRLRIGHPSGVMGIEAAIQWQDGQPLMTKAAVERTARRIMEGTVYVPIHRIIS